MYRLPAIQTEMVKRLGFRQTSNPNIPQLTPQLTQSESGIFIQDRHPLLNTNNLSMASENFDQWPYEAWVLPVLPIPGYNQDVFVKHVNKVWASNITNNTTQPGQSPLTDWTEVNNFSQYLDRILKQASQQTVEKVFQYKALERNTKTLFENIYLFDGAANRHQLVTKQGRFVGFCVRLRKQKHLTALLKKVGTQFNNLTGDLTLYVYHESQEAPILTRTINHALPGSLQWTNMEEVVLPYVSDTQDAGGTFYIGYYEDDLPLGVQSITRNDYKWNTGPCNTCASSSTDRLYFQKWSAHMSWTPIAVPSGFIDQTPARSKFNNEVVNYSYDTNYGLNFHLTLKCDLTDFIKENLASFDEAYANQVAYELLNSFAFTLRDNGDAKQIRDKAAYEMARTDDSGIGKKLEKSFKALDFDLSGFNSICLPDNRRTGARTGTMM